VVAKLAGWSKRVAKRSFRLHRLNIGPRLTLCFVFIILVMLLANAVLLWQFHQARVRAEHLNGVDQELIVVLQAHTNLMSFYERLDVLAHSENSAELVTEAELLRNDLLEESRRTKNALTNLPIELKLDPTLLPTLEAIQDELPAELDAISNLAKSSDWQAVRLRLANQIRPLESRTSALVNNMTQQVTDDQTEAALQVVLLQRRVLLIVPFTAVFTLLIAAFLGLAITRSITGPLRLLVEGSKALARGEFQHQVSVIGDDEIAQLGQVFNDTATRLHTLYETLQNSEAYLQEAQQLTHTGSWVWKVAGGDALHLSDEWYRIYEFDPEKGMPGWEERLQRLHPEDRDRWQRIVDRAIREKSEYDIEFRIVMPNGTVKYVHTVGHPVLNATGELVQFVGSSTDVTERMLAEQTLRRSEGYLEEAQKLSRSGSWAWDVRTGAIFWSQEFFRIYECDPEETEPSWSYILERVHPEDRQGVEQRAKMESTQKGRVDSGGDFRIVFPDGRIKHLHSIAHQVINELGEITEVVGTTMDVTEQREARAALETAFEQIKELRDQLYKENIALREEVDKVSMFEEIVGSSEPLRRVLVQVAKVAATDSTVLILGETGTGKEMIARAIHRRSKRANRAFIRVNCAAIPPALIASELFGHEKGSFTGASQRRLGRFELADGGTIFLDEIGELPAETQSALLRVLQEREFERVGGSQSISVDTRVLSATNRDLNAAVAVGTFRQDLFYRLNVFPIQLPSLRERADDIPLLVEYLIERYAKKAGKKLRNIDKKTLQLFQDYDWPGNIRELQNVVERAVVLCDSETFSVEESWFKRELPRQPALSNALPKGLGRLGEAKEKELIEAALAETGGRVSGPAGAAALLGVPRQTLQSKIASLGINKHRFKSV
jgi:transcriptional regulator with PAS, ATPase and Fis domain/HAMP domain-containing protein